MSNDHTSPGEGENSTDAAAQQILNALNLERLSTTGLPSNLDILNAIQLEREGRGSEAAPEVFDYLAGRPEFRALFTELFNP